MTTIDWEASVERHELKGYLFRFVVGTDEAVFEHEECGALVTLHGIAKHDHFHSLLNVLINSGVMA